MYFKPKMKMNNFTAWLPQTQAIQTNYSQFKLFF